MEQSHHHRVLVFPISWSLDCLQYCFHLIVSNTAFVAKYNHSWVDFIRYVLLVTELRSWRWPFKISCTRKDRKSKQALMRIEPFDPIPHTLKCTVRFLNKLGTTHQSANKSTGTHEQSSKIVPFQLQHDLQLPSSQLFFLRGTPPLSVHTACLSRSFTLTFFSAFAVRHKSTVSWVRLFCFRGISGIDGNTQFQEKSVTLGNICRNTSWIDWAGQICWQIINKTEIECIALWEGRV